MTALRTVARITFSAIGALALSVSCAFAQMPSDPCATLTAAQAGAALGVPVGTPLKISDKSCQWPAANGGKPYFTVQFWPLSSWEGIKTRSAAESKTPLNGVGRDAVYAKVGDWTTLAVEASRTAFVVRVYGVPDHAQQMAIEKSIAQSLAETL
jgi:hypothetical protein